MIGAWQIFVYCIYEESYEQNTSLLKSDKPFFYLTIHANRPKNLLAKWIHFLEVFRYLGYTFSEADLEFNHQLPSILISYINLPKIGSYVLWRLHVPNKDAK